MGAPVTGTSLTIPNPKQLGPEYAGRFSYRKVVDTGLQLTVACGTTDRNKGCRGSDQGVRSHKIRESLRRSPIDLQSCLSLTTVTSSTTDRPPATSIWFPKQLAQTKCIHIPAP